MTREEPGLYAMVWLPNDQQMATILLKNHRSIFSVSTDGIRYQSIRLLPASIPYLRSRA
jgi:hypothetical protein